MKKYYIIVILGTFVLAAILAMLPVEQIIMGYSSSENGEWSASYDSKDTGIFRIIATPFACLLCRWGWFRRYERKSSKQKEYDVFSEPVMEVFFGALSTIGMITCIINIAHFIF